MSDITTQLRELASLVKEGLLTVEEFHQQKARLLGTPMTHGHMQPASNHFHSHLQPAAARHPSHLQPAAARHLQPAASHHSFLQPASSSSYVGGTSPMALGPESSRSSAVFNTLTPRSNAALGTMLPKRVGSYRIIDELGRGAMGVVYRARHLVETMAQQQGGDVALKVMLPHLAADTNFRSLFEQEARHGLILKHPSVVKTHEVLLDGDSLGLVMSLVRGDQLIAYRKPNGLPLDLVMTFLQPLANALDYIHDMGVVHRDLKPENIRLQSNRVPVILDFGIAREGSTSSLSRTGTGMGTVAYMAPEQYVDATKQVGPSADRYALGMIAFELLSGQLPWDQNQSEFQVLTIKASGHMRDLAQVTASRLPPHVSAAISQMTALEPETRFRRSEDFIQALVGRQARSSTSSSASSSSSSPPPVPDTEQESYHYHGPRGQREGTIEEIAGWVRKHPTHRHLLWQPGWTKWKRWQQVAAVAEIVKADAPSRVTSNDPRPPTQKPSTGGRVSTGACRMIRLESGAFWMGASPDDDEARANECPRHLVKLSHPFLLGETQVTQALYQAVTGENPSRFKERGEASQHPVESISWFDAVWFCNKLSELDGLKPAYIAKIQEQNTSKFLSFGRRDTVRVWRWNRNANGYRLPTEAEWEYAARAGDSAFFSGSPTLDEVGWFVANSNNKTHPVRQKRPNAWGLYDLSGNVLEWVCDWYGEYTSTTQIDPYGPSTGTSRAIRGGAWNLTMRGARIAYRGRFAPTRRDDYLGFRLARSILTSKDETADSTSPDSP